MVGKLATIIALIPLSLAWAQGGATQSADPVSVSLKVTQDGQDVKRKVEKDGEIQIIADVSVNIDTVDRIVAMVALNLGDALDTPEGDDDVLEVLPAVLKLCLARIDLANHVHLVSLLGGQKTGRRPAWPRPRR